jgi:hypothetical protein
VDDQQVLSDEEIEWHCAEIERCNRRGGRMLSVVDLVRSATLDLDLAAYVAPAIRRGVSSLVGDPDGAARGDVISEMVTSNMCTIDDVRRCFMEFTGRKISQH